MRRPRRPSRRTVLAATAAASAVSAAAAVPVEAATPAHATAQRPTRELRALLREIDPARIEATVRTLASFGTRHTLSVQDDPVRGIGAARDWIAAELRSYAAESAGRMTVELPGELRRHGGLACHAAMPARCEHLPDRCCMRPLSLTGTAG